MTAGITLAIFPKEFTSNLLGFLLIQPLVLLTLFVSGLRSRVAIGHPYPLLQLMQANGIAIALSAFMPAKAGEFVKPFALSRIANAPITSGFSMVIIERSIDTLVVLLLIGIAVYTGLGSFADTPSYLVLLGLGILGLLVLGVFLAFARAHRYVSRVIRAAVQTLSRTGNVARLTISSIAVWVLSLAMMVVFGLAANHDGLGFRALIIVFVGSTVGFALGVTPGGWGIVEGITIGLLLLYGLDIGEAVSFAVTFRFAFIFLPGVFALGSLRKLTRSKGMESNE